MRAVVAVLALVVAGVAMVLVAGQAPFPAATFEFGKYATYRGVLRETPYPVLESESGERIPLVGEGKHGAEPMVKGADGRPVELKASRIARDGDVMLELLPASLLVKGEPMAARPQEQGRDVMFDGEVVDSKCYLGVMNPGSGKVHRDCALRCISGGVPPGLLVRDEEGVGRVLLLTGMNVKDYAGALVRVEGKLSQKEIRVWKIAKL